MFLLRKNNFFYPKMGKNIPSISFVKKQINGMLIEKTRLDSNERKTHPPWQVRNDSAPSSLKSSIYILAYVRQIRAKTCQSYIWLQSWWHDFEITLYGRCVFLLLEVVYCETKQTRPVQISSNMAWIEFTHNNGTLVCLLLFHDGIISVLRSRTT